VKIWSGRCSAGFGAAWSFGCLITGGAARRKPRRAAADVIGACCSSEREDVTRTLLGRHSMRVGLLTA
jgi:hypothetical protein